MAVVQITHMITVLNGCMAAMGAMLMGMVVCLMAVVTGHMSSSFEMVSTV
ncbi:hypothetical protein GL2_30920 [Microbulbifer sp. GL-2]|nr:hypothetical protein GL2_30920 [Microbulbifer sp. GL-2]